MAAGVDVGDAYVLLDELAPLERHEYHRSESARLSERRRRRLWTLRALLAGRDEPTSAELVGRHDRDIAAYWRWLLAASASTGSRRNVVRGDLVEAIDRDHSGMQLALAAWAGHAEMVQMPSALVAELAVQIDGGARAATRERSFGVALCLAPLSGMPQRLVELHAAARGQELAVVAATLQHADDCRLLAGSMADFHEREEPAVPGFDDRAERRAPELVTGRDGQRWLALAPAELSQLDQDIRARSLIEAIESLRIGEAPRDNIVFKKARGVWRERVARRRDEAGDPQSLRVLPDEHLDGLQAGTATPELSPFGQARSAVQLELESVYREICFDFAAGASAAVFPVDIYGARLSREFSLDHVRAAFNCLRALAATATWRDGVRLPLARHGQREIAQHMARSAPGLWGGDGNGRQTRRGFAAAVAYVGQHAVSRCEVDDLPEPGRALVAAMGEFCAVAVIDGLVAMLLRYRLTAAIKRTAEPPTEKWRRQMDLSVGHMESTMADLHTRQAVVAAGAAPLLAEDLDQLVAALDEFNVNLADRQVATLTRRVSNLAARARTLMDATRQ